ncbi:nucleoside-diphosphate kinase [Pseudaminobacter sp. 19-2017]|uniref:Nucleoside-diphosphate kinase n=1 Tax=Pseudaminobacter soli (ex Zhang et al. 2022) TaxID=2831468 RepID=A0A942IBI3_9HYPH|nr:nucleoside-diphosphate kinase [Pseudaminobacter soli]MBS3652340.1 nucleoside-diphosphate kinase [Pseudaminobacter soli]
MSNETCILTTKDFTILEVMRDRCLGDDPLAPILKRKIETATVVFRDDVPENVATLSSRVSFSVDGRDPDTRVLSHDRMTSPVGMFLPITTPRGLALLGLAEGQVFPLTNHDGVEERIALDKVHYQPEAVKREKEAMDRLAEPEKRRPALKLIRGAFYDQPRFVPAGPDDSDDPGPSAA